MKIITKVEKDIPYWSIKQSANKRSLDAIISSNDIAPIELTNGTIVNFRAGKDDSNNIFLISDECVATPMVMNSDSRVLCGWYSTELREWLNEAFITLLPIEVQDIIKTTVITQKSRGKPHESRERVFVPSLTQIFGKGDWNDTDIGDTQIDIFKDVRNRVKAYNGRTEWWWTRTPFKGNIGYSLFAIANGEYTADVTSNVHGVVPMFRI